MINHTTCYTPSRSSANYQYGRQTSKLALNFEEKIKKNQVFLRANSKSVGTLDTVSEAWSWLEEYTQLDGQGVAQAYRNSKSSRERMRVALQLVLSCSVKKAGWFPEAKPKQIILGVLSADIRLAIRSLRDWSAAANVPFVLPISQIDGVSKISQISGGVYIKYNAATQTCQVSHYGGQDRGVLIVLGGQQFGHFPLGLFDESMDSPPPPLKT